MVAVNNVSNLQVEVVGSGATTVNRVSNFKVEVVTSGSTAVNRVSNFCLEIVAAPFSLASASMRTQRRAKSGINVTPYLGLTGKGRVQHRGKASFVNNISLLGRARVQHRAHGTLTPPPPVLPGPPTLPAAALPGWSVHKKPRLNTLVAKHPSGADVRTALWQHPAYEFEMTYEALAGDAVSYPGLSANSLQTFMGFALALQGSWGQFLYFDPDDNLATAVIGAGDGVTTNFTFSRPMGPFLEPVGWVSTVSSLYVAGTLVTTGFSVMAPNILSFGTAPAAGASIVSTFAYAFLCRVDDDELDFEEFMSNLHMLKSFKFKSLRLA